VPAESGDCGGFDGEAVEYEAEWWREALIEKVSRGCGSAVLVRSTVLRDADGGK